MNTEPAPQPQPQPQPQPPGRDPVLWLLLALGAVYVFWDAARPFNQADSFWYAEHVANMLDSGDLLTLRLGDQPDFVKPPLYAWLTLPFAKLLPLTVALRVVPGLSFLLLLALVHRLTAQALSLGAGRLAALTFLLTYDHLHLHVYRSGVMAGLINLEVGLALWLTLTLRRRPENLRWIGAVVGLTFLTNTAFAVFPTFVAALGLWLQRDQPVRRALILQSVAIAALICAPWLLAMSLAHGWPWFEHQFLDQILRRAMNDGVAVETGRHFGRSEPFYALRHMLSYGQPWTLLAPLAGWWALKRPSSRGDASDTLLRISLGWLVVNVLLFSVTAVAWPWYLSGAYVPLAILVGALLFEVPRSEHVVAKQALGAFAGATLLILPAPYSNEVVYRYSAAVAKLDPLVLYQLVAAALVIQVTLLRRRSQPRDDVSIPPGAFPLALSFAFLGAYVHEDPPLRWALPLVVGLAIAAYLALRRAQRPRLAFVGAILVVAAGTWLAPLRFVGDSRERSDAVWIRERVAAGIPPTGFTCTSSFYTYVVALHTLRDEDLHVEYDPPTQTLLLIPK